MDPCHRLNLVFDKCMEFIDGKALTPAITAKLRGTGDVELVMPKMVFLRGGDWFLEEIYNSLEAAQAAADAAGVYWLHRLLEQLRRCWRGW